MENTDFVINQMNQIEAIVLCELLEEQDLTLAISANVTGESFADVHCRKLWDALYEKARHGHAVEPVGMPSELFGVVMTIRQTIRPSTVLLDEHIKLLKQCQAVRFLSSELMPMLQEVQQHPDNVDKTMESMYSVIATAAKIKEGGSADLGDVVTVAKEAIAQLRGDDKVDSFPLFASKYAKGRVVARTGEVLTLAASTGCGKTALAASWLLHAVTLRKRVLYVCSESDRREIFYRIAATAGGFHHDVFLNSMGQNTALNLQLQSFAEEFAQKTAARLFFMCAEEGEIRPEMVEARIRGITQEIGHVDMVAFDFVQDMKPDDTRRADRFIQLENIIGRIQSLAKKLKFTAVVLSQYNRSAKELADKGEYPQNGWLDGSGALENKSYAVLHIRMKPDPSGDKTLTRYSLVATKCRNIRGNKFVLPLRWVHDNTFEVDDEICARNEVQDKELVDVTDIPISTVDF